MFVRCECAETFMKISLCLCLTAPFFSPRPSPRPRTMVTIDTAKTPICGETRTQRYLKGRDRFDAKHSLMLNNQSETKVKLFMRGGVC